MNATMFKMYFLLKAETRANSGKLTHPLFCIPKSKFVWYIQYWYSVSPSQNLCGITSFVNRNQEFLSILQQKHPQAHADADLNT